MILVLVVKWRHHANDLFSLYTEHLSGHGNRILNNNVFAITILNTCFTFTLHLQRAKEEE